MIRKGDAVYFRAEFRQAGEPQHYAYSDQWDDGRIQVTTLPSEDCPLPPINTVRVDMLELP